MPAQEPQQTLPSNVVRWLALAAVLFSQAGLASVNAATSPDESQEQQSRYGRYAPRSTDPASLEGLQELHLAGQYEQVIDNGREHLEDNRNRFEWWEAIIRSEAALGRYEKALETTLAARERLSRNLPLWYLQHEIAMLNGDTKLAEDTLYEIDRYGGPRVAYYQDVDSLVALGQTAIALGAEPRLVLDNFFNRAVRQDTNHVGAMLAAGNLALSKHDYDLASRKFSEGLDAHPEHPEFLYGLARSFAPSDRAAMLLSLSKALERNENHVPSRLLVADHLIDAEEYEQARAELETAMETNPRSPEAWAYRAVLAHLAADPEGEAAARETALEPWPTNPRVDHLIGKKLSLRYRFAEGSAYQRRALEFNPRYLPAKIQLAQDLLRLGTVDEGWQLAAEVFEQDGYDVTAFNLVNLKDQYRRYATLTNDHFIVKMEAREADIFGGEVMALLNEARAVLSEKYEIELEHQTLVEMFDSQADFAVRTFGLPGNPGYLGVCFGDVITANSPSTQGGSPANWQAVLWHEFAHVITLNLTNNKMPRWLSEGISVYEELERNPAWGQRMTSEYRDIVTSGKLTPVGELSSAFLTAGSNTELQFAYYQSYLVVDFIVRNYGHDALLKILHDLGEGVEINAAIAAHTAPLDEIDEAFARATMEKAERLAPELDWEKPELANADARTIQSALDKSPDNHWLLKLRARLHLEEEEWTEAIALLEQLAERFPDDAGSDSAHRLLARAYRETGETEKEIASLTRLADLDAGQLDVVARLAELQSEREAWEPALKHSNIALAINPFLRTPYEVVARASRELGRPLEAVPAYRTLLLLEPGNEARVRYELADVLAEDSPEDARREVLLALEQAPRFRAAHELLLKLHHAPADETPPPTVVYEPDESEPDESEPENKPRTNPEPASSEVEP